MQESRETLGERRSEVKMLSPEIMSVKGTIGGQPALWIGHIGQLRNCPLPLSPNDATGIAKS